VVILERTFDADGEPLRLEVFLPRPDGGDYRCDFRLRGPGLDLDSYGMGVDSVQALLLALNRAHLDLLCYRRDTGRPVRWHDNVELGLPLPDNVTAPDFVPPSG